MKTLTKVLVLLFFVVNFSCVNKEETEKSTVNYKITKKEDVTDEYQQMIDSQVRIFEARKKELNDIEIVNRSIEPTTDDELSKISDFEVNPKLEIVSKRNRTSKHYLRMDGKTIDAVLSPTSVHFKNKEELWEDIDTNILPTQRGNYAYENTKNNLKSWFSNNPSKEGILLATDKVELVTAINLKMNWLDSSGVSINTIHSKAHKMVVSSNTITYKDVIPSIDNQYVIDSDRVEQNIIINERPNIPDSAAYLTFSEEIELPDNWDIDFDRNEMGLVILNEKNEVHLEIPFPEIYEQNNRSIAANMDNSGFDLVQLSNSRFQINTNVSVDWLNERSYPVVIDPTIVLNGASSGYIMYRYDYDDPGCGTPTTTHTYYAYNNQSARLQVGYYYSRSGGSWCYYRDTRYDNYRSWIKYDTSSIPDGEAITNVEFSANISSSYSNGLTANIYSSNSMGGNYTTSSNASQYISITPSGYNHGQAYYDGTGQKPYVVLNNGVTTRLQNLLPSDYFQIGFDHNGSSRYTRPYKIFDTGQSLLRVSYGITCQEPVASCKDVTAQLDASGNVTITVADIDNGSTAECGLQSMTLSQTEFTCADVGDNVVTLTVIDINGSEATCDATVTVQDNVAPIALCQDITIQLDAAGTASIVPSDIDGGSSDACGFTLTASQTSFDCSNVGANTVTLTVTDANNNSTSCTATVTVEDNVAPVAVCQDIIVQLDAAGTASIVPSDIDGGSSDACGFTLTASQTSFDCSNVGANTVTLTVTDANNNSTSCTATVTVEDNVAPVAVCQDIIVQLDAAGTASIVPSDIDGGSSDACGFTLTASQTSFDCSNVGANTVTLTVTDANNNSTSCTATVTVEDNVAPVAVCQDIIVQLDAAGTASIVPSDIDGGSSDACGFTLTASQTSFDCSNVGANTVTLTVTDANNNSTSCTATVTVEDNVAPVAVCQDIIVQLDAAGTASIVPSDIDGGSSDACGFTLTASQTSFDCSNVGANTVTLTVTDANNNSTSCTATVTVEDNVAPVAVCQDIIVQLDAAGTASIVPSDIDGGSSDACGFTLTASQTSFDCSNVGANTVTLTVTDANNNSTSCTATVTVEDNVAPVAVCQDIIVQLDAAGTASIVPSDIDGGSSDACGFTLTASQTSFDCSNVGANTVTLTVTDANNNSTSCTATVTVEDNVAPVAVCQDIIVQLDAAGTASIVPSDIDGGSSDACGFTLTASQTSFDCSNVGANTVTLTVTDANNNSTSCTATVTVEDNVAPVAVCQDIIVQLDAAGTASIVPSDIDGGSSDACGFTLTASQTSFDCSNVGANTVTLTVTDANNNSTSCTATVTVEDNVAPVALCQDITVQLDAAGAASIVPSDIDGGSSDACGFTLTASQTSFDCSNVGANTVTLTVTDANNNSTSCTATVTVEDNVAPVAVCQDIIVQLDAAGTASIVPSDIDGGSSDACGFTLTASQTSFDCSNVGANTVTLTVTDANNNSTSCTATVTVEDNVAPVAVCQDIIVQLDAAGTASIVPSDIDGGSSDACGFTLTASQTSFDCSNVGANTVTLTVTDANNNSTSCTATVTVEDNVAPVAVCQDIIVQLDAAGTASIVPSDIDGGSSDACGFTLTASQTSFDCSNVGANTVTLTVTDANGNSTTCDATVTVEDNVDPIITCTTNDTRYIDPYQTYYTVIATEFDATATDNCDIASLTYMGGSPSTNGSYMDGVQLNLGINTMNWTAIDVNGNESYCTTVIDVLKRPTTLIYNGDLDEQYSDSVDLSATLTDDVSGNGLDGKTITFTIGTQSTTAITNVNGVASTTLILTQDPANSYTVQSEFLEDASYLGSTDDDDFDIVQEDAIVDYTGQTLQATPSSNSSEALVVLSSNIQDISGNSLNALYDTYEGDIRNAKVMFVDRDNGDAPISGWISVTDLIDPTDFKTGSVSFEWLVDIGQQTSQSYTVGIKVDTGYYLRNSSEDDTVVTVYVPTGDFITGGGYIMPISSAGAYASTEGLKTNFGFNVKYNKKGNKLKGHMNVIFRRLESDGVIHVYQIKSNAVQSLGVDVSDENAQFATFITKSNLTDITDPLNSISLGGNLILKVDMTDRGEPGSEDSIAFNLTDGGSGELLYSSNWTGINTGELQLSGGNLVVHSGFSLNGRYVKEEVTIDTIELKSWPNPSDEYFYLRLKTKNLSDKVIVKVFDVANKMVHYNEFNPNQVYRFGENLSGGVYIVKVSQTGFIETLRLVKY
ncbi:putative secreted protein (Por secretion system target) [Flavobacteriaceae bacterium MAR_2010_105]|nr:putative secreted protein (Por secretion system target) [Flavobacteriaceae bacterium MAR_2010_105]